MMCYPSGRKIPGNVSSAIRFMSKTGGMSTKLWHKHFGRGTIVGQQKQLQRLVKSRIFKRHRDVQGGRYVFDRTGAQIAMGLDLKPVSAIAPQHFLHDETLGDSILNLEKAGLAECWETEKELKQELAEAFRVNGEGSEAKYPDIIFELKGKKERINVALEYERSGKSLQRYKGILWQYSKLEAIDLVIFIHEELAIKRRIQEAARSIGSIRLNAKLGFVAIDKWLHDPGGALIELKDRSVSLRDY